MKQNLLLLTAFLFSLSAYSQCDNGEFKTVNYFEGDNYHVIERDGKIYQRTSETSVNEITDAFEIKDGLLSIKCGDETLEMDQLYSDKVDLEAVAKDLAGALDQPAQKVSLCANTSPTTPEVTTDPTTTTTSTDCGCTLSKKCKRLQAKVCKELNKVKKGDAKRLKLTEKANKKKLAAIAKAEKKEKATLKKIETCKIKQYKKLDKKNKKFKKNCTATSK